MPLLILLLLLLAPLTPRAQELAGHGGPVRALAVLEGGGLASAGFDQAVILWDPGSGTARRVLRWHAGALSALAALPGGGLASAGEEGRIAIWSPLGPPLGPPLGSPSDAEAPSQVLEGHAGPVTALAVAPDGALASAGWDGTVRIWAADGTARVLAQGQHQGSAQGQDPGRAPGMEGHAGPVGALAWTPSGLASAGADGTVRLWDAAGSRVLAELGLPQNALAALPGGALAAGGADGFVRILQTELGRQEADLGRQQTDPGRQADGGRQTESSRQTAGGLREWAAAARPIVALAAAPDGASLAVASMGGSAAIWSVADGRLLRELDGPGLPLWSVAFAADGRSLWTGGQDRRVRRWDAATGAPLGPLAGEAEAALPAGADPDGARVFRACRACHALREDAGPMAGPSLHGIFGRRMGSLPGYAYSPRLARGDITWTPETVADLFTRGPDVVTPGTRMPVQTVGEAGDLAALLRFLEVATR